MEIEENERPPPLLLKLFVAGSMPGGQRALENLPGLREALGVLGYRIEVVDSLEQPEEADAAGIIVMPTLLDNNAAPARRLVCDLGDVARIVEFFRDSGGGGKR